MLDSETMVMGEDFDAVPMDELVRRIHAGQVDVQKLPVGVRQRCVGHLTLEGFSCSEIMQLMVLSERMVRRDRAAVRREGAVEPSVGLGDELLGEYERITLGSVQRLVRMSRDVDSPAYARLWAEEAMSRIYQRFVETARRMKYVEDGTRRRFRENLEWAKEMMRGEGEESE